MNEYLKKHRASGLKVGDKVKIARKAEPNGWDEIWTTEMDEYIGTIGVIEYNRDECGFDVAFNDNDSYLFPYSALERVYENEIMPETTVQFGLSKHHIETIEKILNDFGGARSLDVWQKIGKEISWDAFTACAWYCEYLRKKFTLQ